MTKWHGTLGQSKKMDQAIAKSIRKLQASVENVRNVCNAVNKE